MFFGEFLHMLVQQGFRLSPRDYLRVQELLANFPKVSNFREANSFRHQLASLLCHSPEEQHIFHETWERYVKLHSYTPKEDAPPPPRRDWLRLLPGIIAVSSFLIALGWLGWQVFRPLNSDEVKARANFMAYSSVSAHSEQTMVFIAGLSNEKPAWFRHIDPPNSVYWDFGDGKDTIALFHNIDPPQQVNWKLGDDKESYTNFRGGPLENKIEHHYDKPGEYQVKVTMHTPVCSIDSSFYIFVPENTRVIPKLEDEHFPKEKKYQFKDNSSYLGTPRIKRSWLINNETGFSDSAVVDYSYAGKERGRINVRLAIEAIYLDTTVFDTAEIFPTNFDEINFSPASFVKEDISDLVKEQKGSLWSRLGLFGLLLLYFLAEAIIAYFRKVQLQESPDRGPPLRQALDMQSPPLGFLHSTAFYALARRLRRRREGSHRRKPDIPRTLRATIAKAGMPELMWRFFSQPSQYLLLIESKSYEDHLEQLFVQLGQDLASRDISVEIFLYQRDPLHCHRPGQRDYHSLSSLAGQFAGYRLLILGDGADFFDANNSIHWASQMSLLPERALLSPRPTERWGEQEKALAKHMLVVPASMEGFASLIDQWAAEEPMSPAWWQRKAHSTAPPRISMLETQGEAAWLRAMEAHLGDRLMHWLAACAWYPQLRWGADPANRATDAGRGRQPAAFHARRADPTLFAGMVSQRKNTAGGPRGAGSFFARKRSQRSPCFHHHPDAATARR